MTNFISAAFVLVFLSALGSKILAAPLAEENEDGSLSLTFSPDEYGDDFWPTVLMKRSNFWSPHPSDYNPMRRPGPMPRNSKREEMPYHPYPRVVTMKQRSTGFPDELPDINSFLVEQRRKKQARAANLLFKIGGPVEGFESIRRKPGQKYVPSQPTNNYI